MMTFFLIYIVDYCFPVLNPNQIEQNKRLIQFLELISLRAIFFNSKLILVNSLIYICIALSTFSLFLVSTRLIFGGFFSSTYIIFTFTHPLIKYIPCESNDSIHNKNKIIIIIIMMTVHPPEFDWRLFNRIYRIFFEKKRKIHLLLTTAFQTDKTTTTIKEKIQV